MKLLFVFLLVPIITYAQWVPEQENPGLYEGDMILTPDQKAEVEKGVYRFGTRKDRLWPKSGKFVTIPYEVAGNNGGARIHVEKAVASYAKHTCIRLVPRNGERAYVYFRAGGGCSSPVGYTGGRNSISLPRGCWRPGTVLHEIAHTLGVYHEQSRPDRDNHVTIQWNNISPSTMKHNFNKQTTSVVDSLGTPYDYESMMHYSKTAFGRGRVVIVTKDKSKQDVIGQRGGFSQTDIKQLNLLYRCEPGTGGTFPTRGPIPTGGPTRPTGGPTRPTRGPPSGCKDVSINCSTFRRNCNLPNWQTHMQKYCRRTCNLC